MVHGLSEGDDYELKFVDSADEEVNARLKLMEAVLLAQMHQKGPMTVERAMTPREKILSHLKTLKDEE